MARKIQLEKEADEIRKEFGPWTAHNVDLGDGLYTIGDRLNYDTIKLRRIVQILSDFTQGDFKSLRVLDLGVLEGLYTLELGLQKVKEAIGIEGREGSFRKSEFSRKALSIENISFLQGDLREITEEKYGRFDVVLCLGVLYHLDANEVVKVLTNASLMCDRLIVVDTHISLESHDCIEYQGRKYFGQHGREFHRGLSSEEKKNAVWSSLDNEHNFLLTRKSLTRLLNDLGFSSVLECHAPIQYVDYPDRVTFVAVRGRPVTLRTFPGLAKFKESDIQETMRQDGGAVLQREHSLLSACREAYWAVKRFVRRFSAGRQDEW